jgi:hypothetical protein
MDKTYSVYDAKAYEVSADGVPTSIGHVTANSREDAYKKAVVRFSKHGFFAHPKQKHIMVALDAEADGKEEYIYDCHNVKGSLSSFHHLGSRRGSLGVVGARSQKEAYETACVRFSKTSPKNLLVVIRAEENFRPAESCLTVQGLREWQAGLFGINRATDCIIADAWRGL